MKPVRQPGFALVSAIFLVVIIALIAAFMVSIGSMQGATAAYAVVGTRAQFAARSGIEWGVHQVLSNALAPACFASPTSFTLAGGDSGRFVVTMTCAATPVTEATTAYVAFDIEALAEFGASGDEDYFSRRLSAAVSSAP